MLRKIPISGNSQIKLYKIFSNFFKLGGGPGLVVVQAVVSSNASTGSFSHLLLKNWRFSISKEYRKEVVDWPFNKNLFYRFFLAPVHDGRCRGGQLELPGRLCPHRRPVCPLRVVHVLAFSPTSSGFSHLRSWHDCAGKVIFYEQIEFRILRALLNQRALIIAGVLAGSELTKQLKLL